MLEREASRLLARAQYDAEDVAALAAIEARDNDIAAAQAAARAVADVGAALLASRAETAAVRAAAARARAAERDELRATRLAKEKVLRGAVAKQVCTTVLHARVVCGAWAVGREGDGGRANVHGNVLDVAL